MPRAPEQPGRRLWRRGALVDEADVIVLLLTACTAGGGHQLPVPSSPPDTAAEDSGDTAEQDTAEQDTAEPQHTCEDGPWKQVGVGFYSACGLHEDGCVECWGSTRWGTNTGIYDPPEVRMESIAVYKAEEDDFESGAHPAACGLGADGTLSCWSGGPYPVTEIAGPVAEVVFGAYEALATLDDEGNLLVPSFPSPGAVAGVSGVLAWASIDGIIARRAGKLVAWTSSGGVVVEREFGAADAWTFHGACGEYFCGVLTDGMVVQDSWRSESPEVLQPAGSPWVAVYNNWLVQDAEGFVYRTYPELTDEPWFPEPATQVDSKWSTACAVTFDGRLECSGLMHDTFPPPGSFVVPD